MKYLLLFSTCVLLSCGQSEVELLKEPTEVFTSNPFNLNKVKNLILKRNEGKASHVSSMKNTAGQSKIINSYLYDQLLWDYAVKEVISEKMYSYNVPLRQSVMKDKLENFLPDDGYQVINFYTDKSQDKLYARLREYRPDSAYIDSICRSKDITMESHDYLDYQKILRGEKFKGYIVVYNLDTSPFKLIEVDMGTVKNVIVYNK